tara:strand:+ start:71794 stop:72366 length:573 start_codon:yes stop_codon:yes gene_type:complete
MQGIGQANGNKHVLGLTPQKQKVFYQKASANSRMGGSVPVWEVPRSAEDAVAKNMQSALNRPEKTSSFVPGQAYAPGAPTESNSDEFTFGDVLDIVNPLQHIPLVNIAYREITGDQIKPAANIIGGGLYGGFIGAGVAIADTIIAEETGNTVGGHAMAAFRGERASHNQDLGATIAHADLRSSHTPRYND